MNWYVLHVKTGEEIEVRNKITKNLGATALVPRRRKIEKRQGKTVEVTKVLFQGYVFVYIDLCAKMHHKIKSISGVIRILGEPTQVKSKEMFKILVLCSLGEIIEESKAVIKEGRAKVISGPLMGFDDQIIRIDKRKQIATVSFELFGVNKEVNVMLQVLEEK